MWFDWNRGPQPFPDDTIVEIQYAKEPTTYYGPAIDFDWSKVVRYKFRQI